MGKQRQRRAAAAPPQLVGNAFVHQYYDILHHSPELVHRFYQDVSKFGRPDGAGPLSTITTVQAIKEKILSLEFSEYRCEIQMVDAQESYNHGVLVLVTGCLTGKDNVKRNFAQSFFLAPQDKGYFVLNDVFRYVNEADQQQEQPENQVSASAPEVPLSRDDEFSQPSEDWVPEQTVSPPGEGEEATGEVVDNVSEIDEGSAVDVETPISEVVDEAQNNSQAVVDSSPAPILEEAPKKSYTSIVKVMKENAAAPFPAPSARPPSVIPPRQAPTVATSSPAPEVPASGSHGAESGDVQEAEVDGHSIYIKNLPLNGTATQLEEEFKRFGPIRPDGIQVRSNKQQGFCFGFVEFEVASAVQSAIEHACLDDSIPPSGVSTDTDGALIVTPQSLPPPSGPITCTTRSRTISEQAPVAVHAENVVTVVELPCASEAVAVASWFEVDKQVSFQVPAITSSVGASSSDMLVKQMLGSLRTMAMDAPVEVASCSTLKTVAEKMTDVLVLMGCPLEDWSQRVTLLLKFVGRLDFLVKELPGRLTAVEAEWSEHMLALQPLQREVDRLRSALNDTDAKRADVASTITRLESELVAAEAVLRELDACRLPQMDAVALAEDKATSAVSTLEKLQAQRDSLKAMSASPFTDISSLEEIFEGL